MRCVNVIFLDVDGVLNDYETKEKNPNGGYLKAEITI